MESKLIDHIQEQVAYNNLLREVLETGEYRVDRTGVGILSKFGGNLKFNLEDGTLPLLTTKKIFTRSIILELLWFLRGETNIKTLGCGIWDEWASENGELGPVYGKQWRAWNNEVDQIQTVIHSLKNDPFSRRHIVSAWNVSDLPHMALAPCHCLFQFYVREVNGERYLDCQLYQRSADLFLGVPFNFASYSLLIYMISQQLGYKPGKFLHTFGDVHIYSNHIQQVEEQLSREDKIKDFPKLELRKAKDIFSYSLDDFKVKDYDPLPYIPAPVAK